MERGKMKSAFERSDASLDGMMAIPGVPFPLSLRQEASYGEPLTDNSAG